MATTNVGFTPKQKRDLVEIFVEARLSSLEVRMQALEDKVEELAATFEQRVGIAVS